MELGSVTLKTNNQHTLVCVCGSPKRTNSIPAASVVCPTIPPGRANPFFLSCHNKCPLQRGLCACFVVSRITRSPPICAWPGACRAGRARDRGLNCPSWCVEGFRIGVSQGDLSGRGRAVGLQSRPLDLRSRTLCANPVCGSFVSPRPWKTGWEAEERRATLRAGGRKTGTARSVLYLMMQRSSAAAAPASAGDGGGGGADAAEAGASAERRAGLPCHQERRGQPGAAIGHRGRRLGAPSVRFDTSVSQKPGAL